MTGMVWVWMKLSHGKQLVMMADKQELEIKLLVKSSSQSKKLQKCENNCICTYQSVWVRVELIPWGAEELVTIANKCISFYQCNQTISKMPLDKIYFKKALKF